MPAALFWRAAAAGRVQCELCPHRCLLADGGRGRCGVRAAAGGVLQARGYGRLSGAHSDPVEKKPLYHFHPGRQLFSVGGWGCNLACAWCQNWTISQRTDGLDQAPVTAPAEVARAAARAGAVGVAYTYNEPLINIEFVAACARAARAAGLVNVLVTNGYVEAAPAAWLLPLVDALNIDVKSLDEVFYREHCGGSLAPVLRFARQAAAAGRHVEITNLLIPGLNAAVEQAGRLSAWVRAELGPRTPLHLSAYHPDYRLDRPPTPPAVLERARARCRQDLEYVYLGNAPGGAGQDTACPQCGALLVQRRGYAVRIAGLAGGACVRCGRPADLVL